MYVPQSRIINPSNVVHQTALRYYANPVPSQQSRIIQPMAVAASVGPIGAVFLATPVGVETQPGHLYHLAAKHHDPVAVGTELFVVVVFLVVMGKLVGVFCPVPSRDSTAPTE